MGLRDWFGRLSAAPPIRRFDEDRRLHARDEAALSYDVGQLVSGGRGWIAQADAARMFSPNADLRYAFGEQDEEGRGRLDAFATRHGLRLDLMPDGRVYFTRLS
jgi:hypothetical protein